MLPSRFVDTVLFDAVGTLIFPAEPVGHTYSRFAAHHGVNISPDVAGSEFKLQFSNCPPPTYPKGIGSEAIDRVWWKALVRSVISTAATPRPPRETLDQLFLELFAHYGTAQAWRPFPEVHSVLETLSLRPLNLAVVSNFDARLRAVLIALGLDPFFSATIISSEAGVAKPAPRIFQIALSDTGSTPAKALHVGDCPVSDEAGARSAGIEPVLLARPATDLTQLLSHPRISSGNREI